MEVFENQEFGSIRLLQEAGKTFFCASDVAKALGYVNPYAMLLERKKSSYAEYRKTKSEMQDWLVAQKIVQEILKEDEQKREQMHEQGEENRENSR